jgi:hypothetical protein
MQTALVARNGKRIPLSVSSIYSPLDGDRDWTRRAKPQARRSEVVITKPESRNRVSLRYATVVAAIELPQVPDLPAFTGL